MADLVNGSFETGSLSGWSSLGTVDVRQGSINLGNSSDSNAGFSPTDGSYSVQLTSQNQSVSSIESFLGLSSGSINSSFDSEKNNTYTVGSALKQSITISAGQKVSFDWKFKTTDYWSYNDSAFVISGPSTVKLASVKSAGNSGAQSGTFEYTFNTGGDYTIGVAVFNESDSSVDSYLGLDNFRITGGVVNHAPTTANRSVRINEDAAYTFSSSDFSFSDVDSTDSLKSVLITSAPAAGTLLFNGSTIAIGSNGYSIAKADLGKLSFAPAANANGDTYASFQFKVLDQADAPSAAATLTIDVTPVNDAPTTANRSVRINEDAAYTFSSSDFSFSDVDSGDSLKSVLITSAPAAGTLLFNGSTIAIGSNGYSIAKADLGKLSFAPAANANGDAYASFQFKVLDQSDAPSAAATLSIDVTPVNDAPTTANRSVRINEDAAYTFSSSDFSFSDVDSPDSLKSVLITSASAAGTLLFNGSTISIGSNGYSIAKADLGKLSFAPASNANGDAYASFQFKVLDQADAPSAAATLTIDVTPVNDAPTSKGALDVLEQAYERGVTPLGQTLAAADATGGAGSLLTKTSDIDNDPLLITGVRGLDATGTPRTSEWTAVGTTQSTDIAGIYGTLTLAADGSYTYVVNEQHAAFLTLGDGQRIVDRFLLRISDGQSEPIAQDIKIGINGRDDVAKPTIDIVAGDDQVNRAEKGKGITVSGSAPGASSLDVSWGSTTKHLAVSNGVWSTTFATTTDPNQSNPLLASVSEVPDDWQDTSIRVRAFDSDGHSSLQTARAVVVDTIFPTMPNLDRVAGDDQINANEKQNGISLTGKAEAGATVKLTWETTTKTAVVNNTGVWSINLLSSEIPNNASRSTILLSATDKAGNSSLVSRDFTKVDTAPPSSAKFEPITPDGIINLKEFSQGIQLNGTVDKNASVDLEWDQLRLKPIVLPTGKWSQWVTAQQLTGLDRNASIIAKVTDQAGNKTTTAPVKPIFDLLAPTAPGINPIGNTRAEKQVINANGKAAGVLLSGGIGSTEACSTIRVSWGSQEKTTIAAADGSWMIQWNSTDIPTDTASSVLTVQATDAAGNSSTITSQTLIIDTKAPDIPVINKITGDDVITASEAQGGIKIEGRAESAATVTITGSGLTRTTTATAIGSWSLTLNPTEIAILGDGNINLDIGATDQAGNASKKVSKTVLISTTAPKTPTLDTIASDNRVNQDEAKSGIILSGRTEANSNIKLSLGDKNFNTTADPTGAWTLQIRSLSLPSNDGTQQVRITATNASGLESATLSRNILIDRVSPNLISQTVSDNKIVLLYSEEMKQGLLDVKNFQVLEDRTPLTVSEAKILTANPSMVELSLIRKPVASAGLTTSYTVPLNGNGIQDLSGNKSASYSSATVGIYRTGSSITQLGSGYVNLELVGNDPITGVGNALSNTISGNAANNILEGGSGADKLTGLAGADTFRYNTLTDSVVSQYDWITDLEIGIDRIDGPNAVAIGSVRQLGQVNSLSEAALQQLLKADQFVGNGAATFSMGNRTFLAINDSTGGFNPSRDAIIEITGFNGNLSQLSII